MRFLKLPTLAALVFYLGLPTAQAKEVITLPTIQVMAESELREEVGFIPFQEDEKVRQALQHQIYKAENDIQNTQVNENSGRIVDYQAKTAQPDMSQFSPALQQYILAIATGLQSSDPTNGLFKMLEPLGIDRNQALEGVQNREVKINLEDALRLQQMIQNGLKNY